MFRACCTCKCYQNYLTVSLYQLIHDWWNKGHGMCNPVCGMVHIKEPLLLIKKNNSCSCGRGFPLSLSEWFFTICPTPYNRKLNVLGVSLNKCISFILCSNPYLSLWSTVQYLIVDVENNSVKSFTMILRSHVKKKLMNK